jgi:hypothetical protein
MIHFLSIFSGLNFVQQQHQTRGEIKKWLTESFYNNTEKPLEDCAIGLGRFVSTRIAQHSFTAMVTLELMKFHRICSEGRRILN